MQPRYAQITSGAVVAAAIAALTLSMISAQGWAQGGADEGADTRIRVGTYDPQQVFNAYPGREQMMNQISEIQAQMQQAQQQQDEQRMIELQQRMQQQRNEAIQRFQSDVEQTLPVVAEDTDIDLVAVEVVFTRPGVETRDITSQVIEALGGDPEPAQPQFMVPGDE